MRILKFILGALALLIAAFIVIGFFLPRDVTVARSIEIDAPAEEVFPHINSLRAMEKWSPWMGRDPEMVVTYNEIESGDGAAMEWASDQPDVGNGRQEIIESNLNESVVTALDFGDMGLAEARLLLAEAGGDTTVTWVLDTDMGAGPIGRWFGLAMDGMVGPDYEQGLANLKALVEGG